MSRAEYEKNVAFLVEAGIPAIAARKCLKVLATFFRTLCFANLNFIPESERRHRASV
jgi:hypothetical protein